jgi:hypothetical protein
MLHPQFDGDALVLRPDAPITRADVAELTRTVDQYLATHAKLTGVMIETATFPGYAELGAFADHLHFVADHHSRVRRIALVTDSLLAPLVEFIANHVVGVELRCYPFIERRDALIWLKSP